MSRSRDVSVVVATMSRPSDLALTVTSLVAGTALPREVVVVDASADDGTEIAAGQFAATFRGVDFLYRRVAPGLPGQRNAGLAAVSGEIVLFLDDDVTLEPEFLEKLLAAFDDPAVAGATGVITNQFLPPAYARAFQWLFRQVRYAPRSYLQRSGLPTFLYQPEARADVEILTGCNMAFRREVLGGFDERINYFDDDDISLMVGRSRRLVQVPSARLEHRLATSARPAPIHKVRRRVWEQRLLHRRHLRQTPWNVLCYYYSVTGAALAAALRLRPRLCLGTVAGLWDVVRSRGGRRGAAGEKLLPRPE
jgi:GT2 family glycosyltransferase